MATSTRFVPSDQISQTEIAQPELARHEITSRQQLLAYLAGAAAFVLLCVVWDKLLLPGDKDLWDARVYGRSLVAWASGGDPYSLSLGGLPFVYPPLFLRIGGALQSLLPAPFGWLLYLAVLTVSTLAIPWLLAAQYIRAAWLTPLVAFAIFALEPRLFAEMVLLSGNISALLYGTALLAGVVGVRRNQWFWFYLAVAVAAVIKPPFLALLLLPLFAGRRQVGPASLAGAAAACCYMLQRIADPELYARFQSTVLLQVLARNDAGAGIFSYLLKPSQRLHAGALGASVGHLLFVGILFYALFFVRRARRLPQFAGLWVPALLVIAILANPRLQAYDSEIAFLPAVYLCVEAVLAWSTQPRRADAPGILVLVLPLAVFVALLSKEASAAMLLLLIGSVVVTILRMRAALRADGFSAEETPGPMRPSASAPAA